MTNHDPGHIPVLLEPTLEMLDPQPGQVVLDGTLGRGGHAEAIMQRLGAEGHYVGLDLDPGNLDFTRERLAPLPCRFDAVHSNFARAREALDALGIRRVDALLADLGFASNQMNDPGRGFSFREDGPLDMRLDPGLSRTAADLVNHMDERELADVIFRYGDERQSRRIARKIVAARADEPIQTTSALAEVVRAAVGGLGPRHVKGKAKPIDPATRTFMALRIAVNDELEALRQLLAQLTDLIRPGGVAAMISFHSHEDRAVKQAFARLTQAGVATALSRKPVTPDQAEARANPRSRSAKLRGVRFQPDLTPQQIAQRLHDHQVHQDLIEHGRGL